MCVGILATVLDGDATAQFSVSYLSSWVGKNGVDLGQLLEEVGCR